MFKGIDSSASSSWEESHLHIFQFLGFTIIFPRKKMGDPFFDFMDFLKKPSITETLVDILLCAVPIWVAVMIGLVIGWSWRPRWTGIVFLGLRGKFRYLWTAPPGFGARRMWLAFTALSAFSVCRTVWFNFRRKEKSESGWSPEKENSAPVMPTVEALGWECDLLILKLSMLFRSFRWRML